MAKASRQAKSNPVPTSSQSVLKDAYAHYCAGNSIAARRLARQVVKETESVEDRSAALAIAREIFVEKHAIDGSPSSVAEEIIRRTETPVRAFLFALVAMAIFALLVILANTRY